MRRREYRHPFFNAWDPLLAVVAVVFAFIGVDLLTAFHWQPRSAVVPGGESFHYPWAPVWIAAGAGAALVVAGFVVGMDRQFHNWLCVAVGAGLLTLGTSYVATESVTVTDEGFSARRWWGLQSNEWSYDELQSVTVVTYSGRKGGHWVKVRCRPKGADEAAPVEEVSVPRLAGDCQFTIQKHAAPKGVAVRAVYASP